MFYQPKNAIIVVAGDIDEEIVFKEAKKYFNDIKNSVEIKRNHQVEPKQDGEKRLIVYKDSEVEMVAIAYHIPNFANPDQVKLSALSELLSSGKSSRLNKILIDEKQMVNQIYAYNMENKDPGIYLFLAVCNPGIKAEDVEKEILHLIEEIKQNGIKQEELDKIKINTKSDFIFNMENSSNLANLFGSYFARGDIKPLLNYEEDIENLKIDDLQEVAKKYLKKEMLFLREFPYRIRMNFSKNACNLKIRSFSQIQ